MSLELKFNPNLEYQKDAINAVVDLFKGQTPKDSNFTVVPQVAQMRIEHSGIGIGNKLELNKEQILENLREVQERNGLKQSTTLSTKPFMEFEVDMETGERVIIVMGAINALESRVSGTLDKYIRALLRVIRI